jgi:hypothetical protein
LLAETRKRNIDRTATPNTSLTSLVGEPAPDLIGRAEGASGGGKTQQTKYWPPEIDGADAKTTKRNIGPRDQITRKFEQTKYWTQLKTKPTSPCGESPPRT